MSARRPSLRAPVGSVAILLLSLAAAASTLVGNPTFLPKMLNVAQGVDVPLVDLELDNCQGGTTFVQTRMDLEDPYAVALPSGTWCAITLVFDDAIVVN